MRLANKGLAAFLGAVGAMALAAPSRAEQIVLFDITYTHDASNDAHHGISGAALNQPNNWTSPIDYTQGTIHFYQEVMSKPSNKDTIIDFCLISARDYGCIETFIYKTTGLHETVRSMAGKDVDKRNVIDFTQKMRSIQMVLKTPAPTYINGGSPKSDFLPSKMRFVATLVSPGGTYTKPMPTPGFAPGDGGAPAASDAGAPVMDAAMGTGGVAGAGTGGSSSGSGGSSGGGTGGSAGSDGSGGSGGGGTGGSSGGSSTGGSSGGSGGSSGSGSSTGGSSGSSSGGSTGSSSPSSGGDDKPKSALGCSVAPAQAGGTASVFGPGLLMLVVAGALARRRGRRD
jgi:MYXO-CTERM domain-containing protein